jgi:uncharacterized membrane protein YcaP (DUF421 family)
VLIVLLRVTGKRTLAKWNAFDLVVTVSLGSILATAIISKDVALMQGILAFTVLVLLQFAVTWLSVRISRVENLVKAKPTLLVYQGKFRENVLRRERVSKSEVRAALRENGLAAIADAAAVVLETDGSISVIRELGSGPATALSDVDGFPGSNE